MVSTWIVATIGIGFALFAFITPWAQVVDSNGFVEATFSPPDLASAVGDTYGPCGCPPTSSLPQNASQGEPMGATGGVALGAIVPALVSPTFLAAGAWVFPCAFLLAFLSIFRWKLMVVSGLLFLASGALWVAGMAVEASHVNSAIAQWTGQAQGYVPPTIGTSFGMYLALLSGVTLTAGYFLAGRDVVERPLD